MRKTSSQLLYFAMLAACGVAAWSNATRAQAVVAATSASAPKPDANDITCTHEHLIAISDKAAREKLAKACARRGEFKSSKPKSY